MSYTHGLRSLPLLAGLALLAQGVPAQSPTVRGTGSGVGVEGGALIWDARSVEHLLNRAAFGAAPEEVQHWVEAGPEATLDALFGGDTPAGEPYRWRRTQYDVRELREMSSEERQRARNAARSLDRRELVKFSSWWVGRMVDGVDPLRERMTLFWHGHFTSSLATLRRGELLYNQNVLLREHAIGNYGALLRGALEDLALLKYLDNHKNTKDSPNENLAREVMELFTLGEGHYTEEDVREAARALTGYGRRRDGGLVSRTKHDYGRKTILGVTARHDRDSLAAVLLAQEACAQHIAGQILRYLEGLEPAPERLERYAGLLRDADYELGPMLRALFLDPAFYSPEVVGAKVLSPVDFMVGGARRLGLDGEPAILVGAASTLGQTLFNPPNVKGWEGGMAWLTTSTMMQRGNAAGVLLGLIDADDYAEDEEADAMMDAMMDAEPGLAMDEAQEDGQTSGVESRTLRRLLRVTGSRRYTVNIDLRGPLVAEGSMRDRQIAEGLCARLLAVEPPETTLALVEQALRAEREALGLADGELLQRVQRGEQILRRVAHLILSLPAAQLG